MRSPPPAIAELLDLAARARFAGRAQQQRRDHDRLHDQGAGAHQREVDRGEPAAAAPQHQRQGREEDALERGGPHARGEPAAAEPVAQAGEPVQQAAATPVTGEPSNAPVIDPQVERLHGAVDGRAAGSARGHSADP